ncbi:MAG: protein kinase, partial [bacterium]
MITYFQGYKVGRLLGEGTFGQTHEAEKDGQRVALKLFREEVMQADVDLRRFTREVRALEKVKSPYVIRLLDSGF